MLYIIRVKYISDLFSLGSLLWFANVKEEQAVEDGLKALLR